MCCSLSEGRYKGKETPPEEIQILQNYYKIKILFGYIKLIVTHLFVLGLLNFVNYIQIAPALTVTNYLGNGTFIYYLDQSHFKLSMSHIKINTSLYSIAFLYNELIKMLLLGIYCHMGPNSSTSK